MHGFRSRFIRVFENVPWNSQPFIRLLAGFAVHLGKRRNGLHSERLDLVNVASFAMAVYSQPSSTQSQDVGQGVRMHEARLSQGLPYARPTSQQPPNSCGPEDSRIDTPSGSSRRILPMDGEKVTVEHVLVCSSPNAPVLMVLSKDTNEGRAFYTVKVLEASEQHRFGPPTTSVSCIYPTVTWGVRDPGPPIAKPPPPPPPPQYGGVERQTVVSWPISNTGQAVPKEPPPHQQTGIESQTASTPPPPPPYQEGGMENQRVRAIGPAVAKPPPPHLQDNVVSKADASWPVSHTSQAVPKEPSLHPQASMESQTVSKPPPPSPHLQTGMDSRTGIPKTPLPHPQAGRDDQTVSSSVNHTHETVAAPFDQFATTSSGTGTTSTSVQPPGVTSEASVPGKYKDLGGRYLEFVPYGWTVQTRSAPTATIRDVPAPDRNTATQ